LVNTLFTAGGSYGLGGVHSEACGKNAQASEEGLFLLIE
jgi:hypothetical protein